jgi:hemolysin activation/secretion protein
LLASGTVSGHDGGHISGTGAQIRFINTNHIFTPTSGYNLVAKYINYGLLAGAGRQFQIAELRLKRYLPISEKSVFAFEYLAQDAAGNIPFRKLPLLGGQYLLRGFFLGRFRDNSLQAIQSEYRYTVNEKYGFNSFASAGAVGSDIDSTFRKKWHVSAGVGIRYTLIDADKLSLRLDIARNKEETSIYFGAGEAF